MEGAAPYASVRELGTDKVKGDGNNAMDDMDGAAGGIGGGGCTILPCLAATARCVMESHMSLRLGYIIFHRRPI